VLGLGLVVSLAVAAPASAQADTPGSSTPRADNSSSPASYVVQPNRSSWT
jgi:hypothetical protein